MKKFAAFALAITAATAAMAAGVESVDPAAVPVGTYELDPSHVGVAATVNHLGFSNSVVRFDKVSGTISYDPATPEASTADITIDAASLSSGWAARDGHLKSPEFFNVAAQPTITFKSTSLKTTGASIAQLSGNLTLLGVTQPVTLDVTFKGVGKAFDPATRIGFSASGKIKRSDFGMMTFLPLVGDEATIAINAEFTKKP